MIFLNILKISETVERLLTHSALLENINILIKFNYTDMLLLRCQKRINFYSRFTDTNILFQSAKLKNVQLSFNLQ